MRNFRTVNTLILMAAITGMSAGCQSGFFVSQTNRASVRPQNSKCQKMLEVARQFQSQGQIEQARHVCKLIPSDSTEYREARELLAQLGTVSQPAKINVATGRQMKKIPLQEAPMPKETMPPTPLAEMLVKDLSQEKIQEEKIEQPRLLEIKQPQMERPALENADVNVPQIKKASNELENSVPVSQEEVKIVPEKAEPSGFAKVRLQCRITENQSDPQSMTQVSAQPMTSPSKDVACPGVLLKTETSISELSPVVIEQTPSIKPCDVMELPLPQPLFDNLDSLGKPKTCTTCNIPPSSPEVWRKQAEQSIVSGDNYHQDQNALQKILGQGNLSLKEWDTLNNHGDYAAEFIPEIEKILQSGTSQQQLHAAYTFYQVTGAIEPASSRFKKGLKSTDANEVGIAAFYLGQIGKPANVFVDDLKKLSRNGSPIVRTHASEALIRIDGPRTEYQLALCQCAEDDDSPVRVLAIAGLAQAGMELDNHVRESLFEFVKDEDTEVAAQAMLTLSLLRPVDPRLKEIVMKIKDDNIHPLHDTAVVAWQFMTDKSVTVK